MAVTWRKAPLEPLIPNNSYLSLWERYATEGATQSWPAGSPICFSGGKMIVFVAPATLKVAGIALDAASTVTDTAVRYLVASESVEFEANLLTSAAANYTLAITDNGTLYDLATNANLLGTGVAGWYIQNTTADTVCIVTQFKAQMGEPNQTSSDPQVGDVNARVTARFRNSKIIYV